MTAPDPGEALAALLAEAACMLIKICGITRAEDAQRAVDAGATAHRLRVLAGQPARGHAGSRPRPSPALSART